MNIISNQNILFKFKNALPVGTIIAWDKNLGIGTYSEYWKECDGSTINDPDSPLNGQDTPDLNNSNRFISGSDDFSNNQIGSTSHTHDVQYQGGDSLRASGTQNQGAYQNHDHTIDDEDNLPVYYDVVYLIKIK